MNQEIAIALLEAAGLRVEVGGTGPIAVDTVAAGGCGNGTLTALARLPFLSP